jgi:hypothetical protein
MQLVRRNNGTKEEIVHYNYLNLIIFDLSRNQSQGTHQRRMGSDTQHWIPVRTVNLTAEKRKCNQRDDIQKEFEDLQKDTHNTSKGGSGVILYIDI